MVWLAIGMGMVVLTGWAVQGALEPGATGGAVSAGSATPATAAGTGPVREPVGAPRRLGSGSTAVLPAGGAFPPVGAGSWRVVPAVTQAPLPHTGGAGW